MYYLNLSTDISTRFHADANVVKILMDGRTLQPTIPNTYISGETMSLIITSGMKMDAKRSDTANDKINVTLVDFRFFLFKNICIIAMFPITPMMEIREYKTTMIVFANGFKISSST